MAAWLRGNGWIALLVLVFFTALAFATSRDLGGLNPTSISQGVGEVLPAVLLIVVGAIVLEAAVYLLLARVVQTKYALAYTLFAPSAVGLLVFFVYPFFYDIAIAFSNMSLTTLLNPRFGWQYGVDNFSRVFTGRLLQTANSTFFTIFIRTLIWTVVNILFHVLGGLGLALLLNRDLRLKGLYRTLLVIPWAIPQVIVGLAWRNEFHFQYGFVNILLKNFGLEPINWLRDPFWAFVAAIIVNVWLGIPFMMVIILGGLQSISKEYYEAADIDGASWRQRFSNITLPLLRPVLAPAIALGTIWTFNQINIIFLVTQGGPQESTNILVTALYYAAFDFSRYAFAAAFSLVIFVILFLISLLWIRATGALQSVYE
ncbi:MAG TPA: sugar ABC transporter permease [Chloroflexi bacterium]|nr:sugar ABC transporter permease [Chloroflexota bacterium]